MKASLILSIVFFGLFPCLAIADQLDNHLISTDDTFGSDSQIIQIFGTSTSGTISQFTFETDNPTYWGVTQAPGYITLTQCDSISDYVDINAESTGSCANRVRNEVDSSAGGSISVSGNYVTINFPSPITLNPSKFYIFAYYGSNNGGVAHFYATDTGARCSMFLNPADQNITNIYYSTGGALTNDVCSGSGTSTTDYSTHFISINPAASSTVATTTTTGASIYISPSDFASNEELVITFLNQTKNTSLSYSALDAYNHATQPPGLQYTYKINSSGTLNFSTTTTFLYPGFYFADYEIKKGTNLLSGVPFIGSFLNGIANFVIPASDLAATSSEFVVGALTPLDIAISQGQTAVASYSIYGTNATNTPVDNYCNPLQNFSMTQCVGALFLPPASSITSLLTTAQNGWAGAFPWGYLTRFVAILGSDSTTPLPAWSAPIYLGSGNLFDTISIDPQDMLDGGAAVLNGTDAYGTSMNLQQIVEPWIKLIIALEVLFIIIRDLTKLGHGAATGGGNKRRYA